VEQRVVNHLGKRFKSDRVVHETPRRIVLVLVLENKAEDDDESFS